MVVITLVVVVLVVVMWLIVALVTVALEDVIELVARVAVFGAPVKPGSAVTYGLADVHAVLMLAAAAAPRVRCRIQQSDL